MGVGERERAAHDLVPEDLVVGRAYAVFDQQDSGCLSYGVMARGHRWFVKVAREADARASLENALLVHGAIRHPAIVRPLRVFRSDALALVYPWVPGRVLNHATADGSDRSALLDFQQLPLESVRAAVATVLDAHVQIAEKGIIAVDFYDGCLLYDFAAGQMNLIDLDEYRFAAFVLESDRLPGSLRYMAPEELRRGARIDQQTNVFTLGRMVHHLLDSQAGWRGSDAEADVIEIATNPRPSRRFSTVTDLFGAWKVASGTL